MHPGRCAPPWPGRARNAGGAGQGRAASSSCRAVRRPSRHPSPMQFSVPGSMNQRGEPPLHRRRGRPPGRSPPVRWSVDAAASRHDGVRARGHRPAGDESRHVGTGQPLGQARRPDRSRSSASTRAGRGRHQRAERCTRRRRRHGRRSSPNVVTKTVPPGSADSARRPERRVRAAARPNELAPSPRGARRRPASP